MELTIDQALRQGVGAHKEGKLQDAERLYRAILQAQPNHPDANHNLGVLAVAVGKPLEAIPLFEKALETSSNVEQFWLSYIDALMRLKRFSEVERVLGMGEKHGVSPDKLEFFRRQIETGLARDKSDTRQGLTVSDERERLPDKKKKARGDSSGKAPSLDQLKALLGYYQAGSFVEAEGLATSLTQRFPGHPFAWRVLGLVFKRTGRLNESLLPMQKSVELSPHDAEAHSNLGIALRELGRLDEAEASYRQAIALKPDYAEAHNNLGNTLREFRRLEEAESSYRQAIALKPDYAEAHSNLGVTLKELGRLEEAEASFRQAIALNPDFAEAHSNLGVTLKEQGELDDALSSYVRAINLRADYSGAYINLGEALQCVRFKEASQKLYPILTSLLTRGNFVRPEDVAGAILSLLRLDSLVENLLLDTTIFADHEQVDLAIKGLVQVPLLCHLMQICRLPDLQIEALFVSIRRVLLINLGRLEPSPELIQFLSTLSLHCFINEYIYFQTEEETELVDVLEAAIAESVAQASQPTIEAILVLATYRPLHQYDWSKGLQVLDEVPEVKLRLIEEPLAEKIIAQNIPVLANVDNEVSQKVKDQYEENPYPRWVKLPIALKAKSVAEVCNEAGLRLHSGNVKNVSSPAILIAGCGTGRHSIETASRLAGCRVMAVDLSRASLAYAQRKTSQLGLTNIEYLQADILNLGELGREFDIIESSGVLHHMDDPMMGWRVLVDLLKTGGLMRIGLYSELARRHIVQIREEIALNGIGTSEAAIRKFRQSVVESPAEHHQLLTGSGDFFSLSSLRDLLFHVQEHRFTLPQIQSCLNELGLKFCGFEEADIVAKFQESLGVEPDRCNLDLWHQFEERYPRTFAGMYQFWCQKL